MWVQVPSLVKVNKEFYLVKKLYTYIRLIQLLIHLWALLCKLINRAFHGIAPIDYLNSIGIAFIICSLIFYYAVRRRQNAEPTSHNFNPINRRCLIANVPIIVTECYRVYATPVDGHSIEILFNSDSKCWDTLKMSKDSSLTIRILGRFGHYYTAEIVS